MKAKTKLHKLLSLLLTLAMVLGMLPAMSLTAFAAEPGISITGSTTDSSGTGWSYVNSTKTLTLNDYNGGYIQDSGLNTLNLVLEGTSTITVDDANAKGIALGNNQNLNISGSGSLTINATGGSNLIYGIECNKFTMTSGTVTINANSSKMVYGVNANDSLSVTGGKLTANITGTSDGRGLYCKTGKLTVGSGAEVDVTVTNNGSNNMYGIYNNAYTASVTDNGDIELAGTVTITRDGGSTGSGDVYGIANSSSNSNTDGVISITGGSVTVTNAYYGIVVFTKGHDAAFADVDISGGTVNINSTTGDSLGIVSWNNGVTISGGTVTANTASPALQLFDQDSANKTGLVKITGGAKVSLTSTGSKTLNVQGDSSNTSTRVHQINLTSGGSVTVKSTSSEETDYNFPVRGYFNLGSSTKITEGSFRSTADGINAGGGKLFQSDDTTKQVVVAYGTATPDANSISVNGHDFGNPSKLYYKNDASDTTNDSSDYNAHYDPTTGVLELKNYDGGRINVGGAITSDLTIKLSGTNKITTTLATGIANTNGGNITVTADSAATLEITVSNAGNTTGISANTGGAHTTGSVTLEGYANVTVNATTTGSYKYAYGMNGYVNAVVRGNASFKAACVGATNGYGYGIYAASGVTVNTTGTVDIDVTGCSGPSSVGCIGGTSAHTLTKVGNMKLKYPANGGAISPAADFPTATHATNKDTINRVVSYRYGAPYSVTVNNGSCNAANGKYLEDDTVTVTANTISDLTFKKWTSTDVTFADATNKTTTFTMPGKDVTVTANYNLFTTEPSFARTSDTQGTISFTLAATPSSAPKLVEKNSDTVVGNQYFSGSTLERSNIVTNTGTYAVPNGEYRIAVEYGSVWFYSDVFTVDYTGIASPAAAVGNVTVSGTTGTAIAATEVNITLTNDTFASSLSGDWITNLPAGLSQSVTRTDDTHAKITVTGTPTAVSTAAMTIVIPNAQLVTSDTDLTVTANANAKFNISAPTYTVTINAGANMTLASGNANQSGLSGAMTDTVYTAADGYYFPTDYAVAAVNGISVTRNSYTQITVSGTPTANTTITLDPATAKTLSSIAVTTAPTQTTYTAGENFDPTGMVVTATYSDSSTAAVTGYTVTDGNSLTAGKTSVTISYTEGGVTETTTQAITVNAATKTLSSIAVKTAPTKTTYTAGENFDPAGMVIEATYNDGSKKDVTGYTYAPTAALTTSDTTITISYTEGGVTKTCTQAITVNAVTPPAPATLTGISVKTAPTKVTYNEGESFDATGMVIEATYNDSSKKDVTGYTYAPTAALTTSDTTITISYTEGGVTKTCTQAITVNAVTPPAPATLTGISVKTAPTKVTYNEGESFDATGMVIEATYSDGSKKDVTGYTYAPTAALTTSDTTITISYTEGGVTKTATQAITVNAAAKTLSSIAVTTAPTKVTYTAGEYFNTSGMVVTATYSDSSTKAVTSYTFAPTEALTTGDTSITISYTEGGVTKTATQAITVNAVLSEFTITFDGNGGTPSVPGMTTTGQKLAALPTATRSGSYSFDGWYTAASGGTKVTTSYQFTADTTVYAHWTYTGGSSSGGGVSTYAITVDNDKNGDVTVSPRNASKGTTVTITVEPDKGYTLETITVTDKNGDEIELTNKGDGKYTFKMPAGKVYVEATFMEDNSMLNFFVDVPADAYYYDAVLWAAENGITGGTSDTTFSPDAVCTRAQVVTFLWRAAGSPAAKSSVNPFTDVAEGSYYYDAVLWAVEQGITLGTSDTTFSPNAICSRGQIVTFLWRSQKSPAADSVNPFTDVAADTYYTNAVLWAAKEDITNGTSSTTFSPNADCTRAQIVTFLWRALTE